MKYFIPIILLLSACKLDSDKTIDREKFTFKTGSDTQLFFKNVRQSYYDLEENSAAKFNVFRITKRDLGEESPVLNLAIVINYLQDEAYLLLEPNTAVGEFPIQLISIDSAKMEREIVLKSQNRESTLHFATDIYEDLIMGNDFFLVREEHRTPLFQKPETKEAFRITISDYFRLTRVY